MIQRRPARAEDRPAIAAIWNKVIRETAITFTTKEKAPGDIPIGNASVLTDGSSLLGFTTHAPFRSGPGYRFTHEITIYLDTKYGGQGHGKALLIPLIEECRNEGLHSLIAGLAGENERAFNFFTRNGFKPVAQIPEAGEKFGRWHELVLMQRLLN